MAAGFLAVLMLLFMPFGIVAEAAGTGEVTDPWDIEFNTDYTKDGNLSGTLYHYYKFSVSQKGCLQPYVKIDSTDSNPIVDLTIYSGEEADSNRVFVRERITGSQYVNIGRTGLKSGNYIAKFRVVRCNSYTFQMKFTESELYEEELDSPVAPKLITSGNLYNGETSNWYGDTADYYYFTIDSGSKVTVYAKSDENYYLYATLYSNNSYSDDSKIIGNELPNDEVAYSKKLGEGTYYLKIANGLDATSHYGYQFRVTIEPDPLEAFVRRMYQVVLGRDPDDVGLRDWVNRLESGQAEAVDIVEGFLLSPEYQDRQKSNSEIVTDAYNAMLGRTPDDSGFNYWRTALESGMTTKAIIAGFVGSDEFIALCNQYEISPGTYAVTEARDVNIGITEFVSRLYTQALGRSYDVGGLNNWCEELNTNPSRPNILTVSTSGFFHSQEFLNKNLNNEEFVKVLYRTFLGREYDEAGLADWVGQLDRGEKNRDQVMEGFAYSPEFGNIMAQYGL